MLWLRKKEIKDGVIYYYYYQIEGKGEWGELYYDPSTDNCGWVKLAEDDEDWFDRYRAHAYCRLMDYYEGNRYPEKEMVAWG